MNVINRKIYVNPFFKKFSKYVMRYWRPNTEAYIKIVDNSKMSKYLKFWFDTNPDLTVTIGPYKDIYPYTYYNLDYKDEEGNSLVEFLFLYDDIINSKLTAHQLTLGREDFIDL